MKVSRVHKTSDVLISVHHRWMAHFLAGSKTVEIRRRTVDVPRGSRVWLYCTLPCASIRAFALVETVVNGSPTTIWQKFGAKTAVKRTEFDSYLDGIDRACAIVFRKVIAVDAIPLSDLRKMNIRFHPPQFYKKLGDDTPEFKLMLRRAAIALD
jgi:predicted transcriptional regulator